MDLEEELEVEEVEDEGDDELEWEIVSESEEVVVDFKDSVYNEEVGWDFKMGEKWLSIWNYFVFKGIIL